MFGMLNATLKTASRRTGTQDKAEAKQKEVAARLAREQEVAAAERVEAAARRLEEAAQADRDEEAAVVADEQPKWDTHNEMLASNFILLSASPRLFYLPAKHNKATHALLADSQAAVLALAADRQRAAADKGEERRKRRFRRAPPDRHRRSSEQLPPAGQPADQPPL